MGGKKGWGLPGPDEGDKMADLGTVKG